MIVPSEYVLLKLSTFTMYDLSFVHWQYEDHYQCWGRGQWMPRPWTAAHLHITSQGLLLQISTWTEAEGEEISELDESKQIQQIYDFLKFDLEGLTQFDLITSIMMD